MRRLLLLSALALISPFTLRAQTDESLRQAISYYQNLQIEQAREVLRRLLSPSSPFEVTAEQRVTAYLYLGATFVSLNQPDSAIVYYRAAIERDPFADLDPQIFTAAERNTFADARQISFRVGVRPVETIQIDPRRESVVLEAITTHDADLRVEVSHTRRQIRFPIFEGANDGLRQISWSGNLPNGDLVPPGTYELKVTGGSIVSRGRLDSASVLFDVRHQFETLEDTLRNLLPDELLPERRPASLARNELLMGLGVAAASMLIPPALGSAELGQPTALSISMAGLGAATGIFSYIRRRNNPEIAVNIAENQRRELARQTRNAEIRQSNADKLARTRLNISPTVGGRR
jgi:tetratricopeptide (TPR) repeat protein